MTVRDGTRIPTSRRIAPYGLVVVLVLLTGFALWSAVSTHAAVVDVRIEEGAAAAGARLADLESHQAWVLVATPIAFALGLGLLGAFARILMAHRRRADEAVGAELRRLEQAVRTDSLTGLSNHRAFQEDIGCDVGHRERQQTPLSLVMVDVDGLKAVNDAGGHDAGDQQLKAVADALRDTARDGDAVYRLREDEFAVILTAEHGLGAFRFAQRVREQLVDEVAGHPVSVTAGVAEAEGAAEIGTLIRQADVALVEAKRSQHSALIYSPELEPQVDADDQDGPPPALKALATALARAVDAKDSHARSHSETVAELCAQIAAQLGLGEKRIAKLRLAGLLHDVGKIGIKDAVLQKPAKLTDDEYATMKTHASLGHRILSGTDLDEEAVWILHHHEHLDGCGYPYGLSDDAIPLESRIILVADAFEAITADRPYRKARSDDEALAELERHAGTQFDPACVAALARALRHDAPLAEESPSAVQMVNCAAGQPVGLSGRRARR